MNARFRRSASLGAAIAASLLNSQAHAQADERTAAPGGLEEVIVTATKREESLVEVPISMSVFTAGKIAEAGISRPADFLISTPNVTFIEDNSGEAYVNIRGQTAVRNSGPNVAIVIDGVTLTSIKPFNQDLFNIEQIEVLKGPQSALYGRNAAAGAIVITTKRPSDEFEGEVQAEYGNFNTVRASGSVSGPVTDTLKFGVAASYRDTDGPFESETTGDPVQAVETLLGRARLIYEPNDRFTVDLRIGGHSTDGSTLGYNAQAVGLPLGPFPGTELDANIADMPFVSNIDGVLDEQYYDGVLRMDYEFDFGTLTSITGYNELDQFYGGDLIPYVPDTGTAGAMTQNYTWYDKNFSQEVRLTSRNDGRLRWQAGLYYLNFKRDQYTEFNVDALGKIPSTRDRIDPITAAQPTVLFNLGKYETTNFAPFASVQYDITDAWTVGLAGRYDTEDRSIREAAPDDINPITGAPYNQCVALTGVPREQCKSDRTFKQFQPKASLTYSISDDLSTYLSYGKGYKSGGFNPIGSREALLAVAEDLGLPASSVYVKDSYEEEISESYELGAKGRFFDRRLSLNAAVFMTDVEGAQQFEFYPTIGLQATISVDKVKLKGFEFDFDALLPADFRLFGSYGYTDGEVDQFAGNPSFQGNVAPGATQYTVTLGATKEFDLGNGLSIVPRVEYNGFGSIWWDVGNTPGTERDPLDLFKARLSLKSGDRWEVSAYGDNLTNEKYFQEVVPLLGVLTVNYRGPTRTYGIEARYNF